MSRFDELESEGLIRPSSETYKITQFLERAEESFAIAQHLSDGKTVHWHAWSITVGYYAMLYAAKSAILRKGYEVKSHEAAEVALGQLLVPDSLEREDLELLGQAHRIFEEEYVHSFREARKESQVARYRARPSYTERRMHELLEKARAFVAKISLL